ncbi:MAG TPA: Mur ligase family protein [Polyangia bacterium]
MAKASDGNGKARAGEPSSELSSKVFSELSSQLASQPPSAGRPRLVDLLRRLDSIRALGVDLGLQRVRTALDRLGNPERAAPAVHIAGTNGKGSTAAMTEAILRAAGLRTGLFTSPHLVRFTERIRIDGSEAEGDHLAELDARIVATGVPLTYFEVCTALAFLAFAEAGVDVMVLETGLGGRLDATTACWPVATAITSIGHDHLELLGPTLLDVAREKAGIAKPGVPLWLGPLAPEIDAVIAEVAAGVGAPVRRAGRDYPPAPIAPSLGGAHQAANAALAVALARAAVPAIARSRAATAGGLGAREADARLAVAIRAGLTSVTWPGRLEWLGPDLLLDCAHNTEGAEALAAALDALPHDRRRALVLSIVDGKPAAPMLALLVPRFDVVVATRSPSPRAVSPPVLAALARAAVAPGRPPDAVEVAEADDPAAAVQEARRRAGTGGLVVVAGSMFLVGAVRAALLGEPGDPVPTSDPLGRAGSQR